MSITVNIDEAKARLSELVSKVEAGEEVIIARAKAPIARLVPFEERKQRAVIDEILAIRDGGRIKPVTRSKILAWRHQEHKCYL
jgi:prevent-host-death family protein